MKTKIKDLERWCEKNKGYSYEYAITVNEKYIVGNLLTGKKIIFVDEESKLKRYLKRNKWIIQHIRCEDIGLIYGIIKIVK